MIISAGRRTDIPAFYSEWFFNRIKEGFVLVPNPFNPKMISRVGLEPEVVDCIVFWTKNPALMIRRLDELKEYKYYFQFTLNPYGEEIETRLPSLSRRITGFKELSERIGKERVIWRYDPIFTNRKYTVRFHEEAFAEIAGELQHHTEKCMLGFIDHYPHIRSALNQQGINPLLSEEVAEMAESFARTVKGYSFQLNTCTLKKDLSRWGIPAGMCIDKELVERVVGYRISAGKDKNQRKVCNCIESIDISTYETCLNGCIYCYAIKGDHHKAAGKYLYHNKESPLLIGDIPEGAVIRERSVRSLRDEQGYLF